MTFDLETWKEYETNGDKITLNGDISLFKDSRTVFTLKVDLFKLIT